MRELQFGEGHLDPVLRDEKRITIRRYRPEAHFFEKGERFTGVFADGAEIGLVTTDATELKSFNEITDEEAREDGFEDADHLFQFVKENYYPDLERCETAAVIRFRVDV